eukprot:CAMPEP_0204122316 /NCGR_PEP_ID=MMETSP0361-20130328/8665_1 /ASSEMBLY_ACC=CAM_ASM_000343 /TAXON_ID=268821 /ORGANISM="Scrippsiella Hangoei, Strain SHTV-5" /LENGTH=49 /DNA_ID=CAMNT_0051073655 /DNA_START=61 /DNA_END=210 /DNA_ORIENTATION=+
MTTSRTWVPHARGLVHNLRVAIHVQDAPSVDRSTGRCLGHGMVVQARCR